MSTLVLTARDYLNRDAVTGFEIAVQLKVVAQWREEVFDPSDPPPEMTPGDGPMVMARGGPHIEVVRQEFPLEVTRAVTDSTGEVTFDWPFAAGAPLWTAIWAARRLRVPGNPVISVFVTFRVEVPLGARVSGTTLPRTAREDETVSAEILFDLAETIVGHTTESSARLWFRTHLVGMPAGSRFVCSVFRADIPLALNPVPLFEADVTFDSDWADTAVVDVTGLAAGSAYQYRLTLVRPDQSQAKLTAGSFRTAETRTEVLRVAFGSCHQPLALSSSPNPNERWDALDQYHPDLVLLMGDQVYGDAVTWNTRDHRVNTVFQRYAALYERYWMYPPVRNVLRHQPVYMILDDHDIADDWGTTFSIETGEEKDRLRVNGGMKAYHAFQQAHNPSGRDERTWATARVDYSFTRGQVAFYALDGRTQRGRASAGSPVLGEEQRDALRTWASTGAGQAADVIVIIAPVPFAFGDIELAERIIKAADTGVSLVSAAGLGLLAGGVGFVAGLFLGDVVTDYALEEFGVSIVDGKVVEPDLADHRAHPDNRADLANVLNTLFDLANDVTHNNALMRAVVVVSGDIHAGGILRITSTSQRHRSNPVIWQFISSPISHEASSATELIQYLDFGERFYLCSTYDGDFYGQWECGPMDERNFGTLAISRPDPAHRIYGVTGVIRGQTREYRQDLVFNLEEGGVPRSRWALPRAIELRARTTKYAQRTQRKRPPSSRTGENME